MANSIIIVLLAVLCISAAEERKALHFTSGVNDVTTQDGYILSLRSIQTARSGATASKPPVLLQHGIGAASWLFSLPDAALAFVLADNGYDVWLVNTRGTRYSSGHTSLTPDQPVYWDWTWDQLVADDLPASVQYVYGNTKQKLHYVGHSLGTLLALAAFSQNKLLESLRSAALLSPIAHLEQLSTLIIKFAADAFLDTAYWLGLKEFDPVGLGATHLLDLICHHPLIQCSDVVSLFTGPNCCINPSTLDAFIHQQLQPTSTKNLIHLYQMIRNRQITMYDYVDPTQNTAHYGQPTPPLYDLTLIPASFPLFISNGGMDALSHARDVQVLLDNLQNHDKSKLVVIFLQDYAHLDFTLGASAGQVLYQPMMTFFDQN